MAHKVGHAVPAPDDKRADSAVPGVAATRVRIGKATAAVLLVMGKSRERTLLPAAMSTGSKIST